MDKKIKKVKISDLIPSDYNPRRISPKEKENLTTSLSEFGLVDPIIVNLKNNNIIGGHQRYNILYEEDKDKYVYLLDLGDVGWVIDDTHIEIKDEAHEKALNLALNRIQGEFDINKLNIILDELIDLNLTEITGFDLGLNDISYDIQEVEVTEENLKKNTKEVKISNTKIRNDEKFKKLKDSTPKENNFEEIPKKKDNHFVREGDVFKIRNNMILYKDYTHHERNDYVDKIYPKLDLDDSNSRLIKRRSFNLNIYSSKKNTIEDIEKVLEEYNNKENIFKL